jgi:hypothetical protein
MTAHAAFLFADFTTIMLRKPADDAKFAASLDR